jgi:hypothetical protein
MGTNATQKVKIVSKPSLSYTLKSLEIGSPTLFANREFKVQVCRVAASELKKKGFEYKITEEGLVDEYIVTRLK